MEITHLDFECPFCKNKDFLKIDNPIEVRGDAYMSDGSEYFVCRACGFVARFNKDAVAAVLEQEKKIEELKEQIKLMQDELIEKSKNLQTLKEQLETYKQIISNPDRTFREDQQLKKLIEEAEYKINSEERDIARLQSKIKYHQETIEK